MTFVKRECVERINKAAEKKEEGKRSKRLTGVDTVLWEGGMMPYTFGPYFTGKKERRCACSMQG